MKIRLKSRFNDNRLSRGSISLFLSLLPSFSLSLSLSLSLPLSRSLSLFFYFARPRSRLSARDPTSTWTNSKLTRRYVHAALQYWQNKKKKKGGKERGREREREREGEEQEKNFKKSGKKERRQKRRKKKGKLGKTRCGVLCREASPPFQI